LDVFLCVNDLKAFHKANITENKHHYTYAARLSHCKSVLAAQRYGAKTHFNTIRQDFEDEKPFELRYGVVSTDDAIADLTSWEALLISC
jgi:hypothetical protein